MPRTPNTPCVRCGTLCWPSKTGRPQTCRPCRTTAPAPTGPYGPRLAARACGQCGITFQPRSSSRVYCGQPCSSRATGAARQVRPLTDRRVKRKRREQAPGLTYTQQRQLLAQWRRQHRSCTYCPRLADTIDHVIPLVRGGTNHEGNLTPTCRSCNASKCADLVATWRHRPARNQPDNRRHALL